MRKIQNPQSEIPLDGLEDYYEEFLTSRETEFKELQNALSQSDFATVMALGHKWKGFCAPYGFGHLGHLAAELEEAARHSSMDTCQALTQEIREYLSFKKTQT